MQLPVPLSHLAGLRGYQAVAGIEVKHNLSANESCLGASSLAIEAAQAAAKLPVTYPDGSAAALREAIAHRYGIDAACIICGAGSEELISLIVQSYAAPLDEVLFSQYGFIKYELAARAYGAEPVRAREVDFTANVDELLAAVTPRTRVLFLANPNNPTGTYLPDSEIRRLRELLRSDILLVIDAAYAEYVEAADYSDGLALAASTPNTLVLRTFSKIHGLAGLRCGWGFGDQRLLDTLHKVRGAFNVSSVAQAAGAAAISDHQHEERARVHNSQWRSWLAEWLASCGLQCIPSVCNFLVVRFPDPKTREAAGAALANHGILVMPLTGYGLPDALRITVGTEAANRCVAEVLARTTQ